MTKQTEALRMAIESMESAELVWASAGIVKMHEAIEACKEALAQPAQEPVAWMNDIAFSMDKELLGTRSRIVPLYTTPPSREWQSLSDEEIIYMYNEPSSDAEMIEFAREFEAKLREKNELFGNSR